MKFSNKPTPTEINYFLKCKIVIKEVTYLDKQSKGDQLLTEKFVYLIPQESTQRDNFLMAWLPETKEEVFEIGLKIAYPISGFSRACIKRSNSIISEPHIFVMSKGAEEDLKDFVHSKRGFFGFNRPVYIEVEVLGEQDDELLDKAKDYDLRDQKDISGIKRVTDA